MVETVKKPSSNRSAKERRNMLFRVLDGVLSMSHKNTPAATAIGKSRDGRECELPRVMPRLFHGYVRPIRFIKLRNFSYILRYSFPFSVSFREFSS
jgi:hypothetical protein